MATVEECERDHGHRSAALAGVAASSTKQHYRAKVFKSGNSLAVRIPAGTKLSAGMEMDLMIEDGAYLSLQPIDPPKRKFDIDKVWGSATTLKPIDSDDRWFEERSLHWSAGDPPA